MSHTYELRKHVKLLGICVLAGCWSSGITDEGEPAVDDVTVTVNLRLRGTHSTLGTIQGQVYAFAGTSRLARAGASLFGAESCALGQASSVTCQFTVPRGSVVTLLATEGRPSLVKTMNPEQPSDTAHSGAFVEFSAWEPTCPVEFEPGACVLVADKNLSIGAAFQLMTELVVYQIGTAHLDYLVLAPSATLTIPAEESNLLHSSGCLPPLLTPATAGPCSAVSKIGATPMHRLTAFLTHGSTLLLFPNAGADTEMQEWAAGCSYYVWPSGCAIVVPIAPDSTGVPVRMTLKYDYWACASGPEERALTGEVCVRVKP